MLLTEVSQKINLVEGEFTASEASDVISSLIDEKINFHKLQRLKIWEGDVHAPADYANDRIQELKDEKEKARNFIREARKEGRDVKIEGTLKISFL